MYIGLRCCENTEQKCINLAERYRINSLTLMDDTAIMDLLSKKAIMRYKARKKHENDARRGSKK
jgi:hypothetical protein